MNKKSIAANVVWSIISLLISTVITMFILPYVSDVIGIEAYGYIALSNNIVLYIDLIASTINIYAVKFIAIEYHSGNFRKARIFYNSVFTANIIIAIVLLIPVSFCITYIDKIFDIPPGLTFDIRILFIFTLVNYVISIVGTVFTVVTFVKDILYKDSKIRSIGIIMKGVIILVLFTMLYPHVWYVALASTACSSFIVWKSIKLTHIYIPEFKIDFKLSSIIAVKEIAANGIWNTVAGLGTTLNSGLDLLVTNIYLGATEMGQLSVPKTLSAFIVTLLTAVTNSFRPQLLLFYTNKNKQALNNGFMTSMKLCGLIACTIISVFTVCGYQFLKLWIPKQDIDLIYNISLLTFLAETFSGFVKPLHYGAVLTGKLKFPCISNLLVGVFNVISMMIFLNITRGGLYVVALTTVVGNIGYNFIIMPLYVTKLLDLSRKKFYILIFRFVFTTLLIIGILFFVFNKVRVDTWGTLFFELLISVAIIGLAYMLMMLSKEEKKKLFGLAKGRL